MDGRNTGRMGFSHAAENSAEKKYSKAANMTAEK